MTYPKFHRFLTARGIVPSLSKNRLLSFPATSDTVPLDNSLFDGEFIRCSLSGGSWVFTLEQPHGFEKQVILPLPEAEALGRKEYDDGYNHGEKGGSDSIAYYRHAQWQLGFIHATAGESECI